MYLEHTVPKTNGKVYFIHGETEIDERLKTNTEKEQLLTIVFNTAEEQEIIINDISYTVSGTIKRN